MKQNNSWYIQCVLVVFAIVIGLIVGYKSNHSGQQEIAKYKAKYLDEKFFREKRTDQVSFLLGRNDAMRDASKSAEVEYWDQYKESQQQISEYKAQHGL